VYDNIRISPDSSFIVPAPRPLHCECKEQGSQCCGHGFSVIVAKPTEGYDVLIFSI